MAQALVDVGRGLSINEAIWILSGAGTPGSGDSGLAPVGSNYSNENDGTHWFKHSTGTGIDKWTQFQGIQSPTQLNNVTNIQVLDQVFADDTNVQKWIVEAVDAANVANRIVSEVVATHNGGDAADATDVDWDEYGLLKMGTAPAGYQIDVALSGTGTGQVMQLKVSSTTAVNVTARKVSAGQPAGNATALDVTTVPHDISTTFYGAPADSDVVMLYAPSRSFKIAANFPNSVAIAATAATAEAVFTVEKVVAGTPTQIGTITFAAAGTVGTFGASSEVTLAAGDVVRITAPATADATLADLAITIQSNYL